MQADAERAALLDLVARASGRDRREVMTVLLATYRVELTQALRTMANHRAESADFDRVFALAAEIAAAAEGGLTEVRVDALALERAAAAAHLGGLRGQSELLAAGLKVVEQILASTPDRSGREERPTSLN